MTSSDHNSVKQSKKNKISTQEFSELLGKLPHKSAKVMLIDKGVNNHNEANDGDAFGRNGSNAPSIPHLLITISISIHPNIDEYFSDWNVNFLSFHLNRQLH